MRILVIEDETKVGCFIKRALEEESYRSEEHTSELQSLLDVAESIVVTALARKESRGAQYRSDFPVRDDQQWLRLSLIRRTPEGTALTYEPVTVTRFSPT